MVKRKKIKLKRIIKNNFLTDNKIRNGCDLLRKIDS